MSPQEAAHLVEMLMKIVGGMLPVQAKVDKWALLKDEHAIK